MENYLGWTKAKMLDTLASRYVRNLYANVWDRKGNRCETLYQQYLKADELYHDSAAKCCFVYDLCDPEDEHNVRVNFLALFGL